MYAVLSAGAAIVGLIVAGFGVFAAYLYWSGKREAVRAALRRWTVFDYLILAVFLIGTLFLAADAAGVVRDREAYPYYHYGYLLSGLVYNALAGLFLFVRLGLTIRMADDATSGTTPRSADGSDAGSNASPGHDDGEPDQAERAEERV